MHDLLIQTIFYSFAALAIISAFFVVVQNNPVRCTLFLVLCFFASTVLWILVHAEFLALILILVYVGAVMTLFLFVIMMLNINVEVLKTRVWKYLPFGLLVVALLVGIIISPLTKGVLNNAATPYSGALSNTQRLGMVLYTDYVLAFEVAAIILLVAIISAITLVHRRPRGTKQQNIVAQLMVSPKDRLRIVKMNPEK